MYEALPTHSDDGAGGNPADDVHGAKVEDASTVAVTGKVADPDEGPKIMLVNALRYMYTRPLATLDVVRLTQEIFATVTRTEVWWASQKFERVHQLSEQRVPVPQTCAR